MSAASHTHRTTLRKSRGQSIDYTAKNAGRRTDEARQVRRKRVVSRRPPVAHVRGGR